MQGFLMTPSTEELAPLIRASHAPCVSIYMPTHRRGAETRENPIRFKNLLSRAEKELSTNGVGRPDARDIVEPARSLFDEPDFWQHQKDGLAVFLGNGTMRLCKIPYRVPEEVQVSDFFSLRPLLPMLNRRDRFYVLALSQKNIRLFEAVGETLHEVDLPDAPKGLPDLLQYIDEEKSLQFHTGQAAADGGLHSAVFHGQGGNDAKHKKRIFELFRTLDEALRKALIDRSVPLVAAGDKPVVRIFREATTYPTLLDNEVVGNPDHLRLDELLSRAVTIAQPVLEDGRRRAVERFEEARGTPRATTALRDIIRAAHYGQLELLLVDEEFQGWGAFDPQSGETQTHNEKQPGDRDLIELAVLLALRSSAEVHELPRQKMGQTPIAAVLRPGAAETIS